MYVWFLCSCSPSLFQAYGDGADTTIPDIAIGSSKRRGGGILQAITDPSGMAINIGVDQCLGLQGGSWPFFHKGCVFYALLPLTFNSQPPFCLCEDLAEFAAVCSEVDTWAEPRQAFREDVAGADWANVAALVQVRAVLDANLWPVPPFAAGPDGTGSGTSTAQHSGEEREEVCGSEWGCQWCGVISCAL
eukprot:2894734-Amphidinium_carterae.3